MLSILRQLSAAAKGRMFAPESFSGADLGYRIGKAIFKIGDGLKASRRRLKRWLRSPAIARRLSRFQRAIARRDWESARTQAREIASLAEAARDARLMEEMGLALLRLGDYGRSGRLRLESRRLLRGANPKEWRGEAIAGTLLVDFVESEAQGMGGTIQHGRFVAEAAKHATRCVALVQPRLVPLFSRSFAGVETRAATADNKTAAYTAADRIAGFEQLNAYVGTDAEAIARTFVPLRPDPKAVEEFSARYRVGKPLVGISWGSSAYAKDTPSLDDWAALLAALDVNFVSLQYGNVTGDLARLAAVSQKTVINDSSVDQLTNLDRFAAQIFSLDAVVTISNTGAHLAGALGVPSIVIIDDNFRRAWPVGTDHTPYYPQVVLVAKDDRGWTAVMGEVRARLGRIFAQNHPG
ncbi:MAG TPA: hypothetical protein VKT73_09035 [Xanthobacteraceae bacterium]|nr:hypothetical protein [Xanthobacteraceae bacterium]